MIRKVLFGSTEAIIGTFCLTAVLGVIVFGCLLSPYSTSAINATDQLQPPSWSHLLGTDSLGRDIFTRLAHGGIYTLTASLVVILFAGLVGMMIGCLAASTGGRTDRLILRICDAFQAFPQLVLAMLVAAALGNSMKSVTIGLAVAWWPYYAKVARGVALSVRESTYVESAYGIGAKTPYVLWRHIIPGAFPVILTQMTMGLADAIIVVGGLSFLGLGAQQPTPEWGAMIADSADVVFQAPWYALAAGGAILITNLGLHLLGDSLRDNLSGFAAVRPRRSIADDGTSVAPPAPNALADAD